MSELGRNLRNAWIFQYIKALTYFIYALFYTEEPYTKEMKVALFFKLCTPIHSHLSLSFYQSSRNPGLFWNYLFSSNPSFCHRNIGTCLMTCLNDTVKFLHKDKNILLCCHLYKPNQRNQQKLTNETIKLKTTNQPTKVSLVPKHTALNPHSVTYKWYDFEHLLKFSVSQLHNL